VSRYFIDRPIFAWVLAILLSLFGVITLLNLPVAQFPSLGAPQVSIDATFPGADAETVQKTVTQVIEQQLQGLDHLRYFSAQSSSNGQVTITVTFDQGTDPDIAQVQVNNKVQSAVPLLPPQVQQFGVQVNKSTTNFGLVIALYSADGSHNGSDLADLLVSQLNDPISRINGVGRVTVFGSQYAMRVWVDPFKLNSYQLTIADVANAIKAQNAQVSGGQLGALPAPATQQLNVVVHVQSRLETPDQFGLVRLKTNQDGSVVRLRDVARIELGSENYNFVSQYNGMPAAGMVLRMAPGANLLQTVGAVKAKVDEISKSFPPDVKILYPWDTTPFVNASIEQITHTLVEAIALVFLVMFLFLQDFRATIIPTIAIPVVLLGTFVVLGLFGYSVNTLTMFGIVLAIGLLVDDAIVVIENVERVMQEEHLSPKEAARKSMDQISGALVAIAMVLSAVFLPMVFFGGSAGIIYRQFAITIVSAMALSVLVALIFTPALAGTMLKPHDPHKKEGNGPLARFFRWFNDRFERSRVSYVGGVRTTIGGKKRAGLLYLGILAVMGFLFWRLPTGFLPEEDLGTVFAIVQGPSGATLSATQDALDTVRDHFLKEKAVDGVFTVAGFSFSGTGQNTGISFVHLKPWDERPGKQNTAQAIAHRAAEPLSHFRGALIVPVTPPAALELGNSNGFDLQLVDTGNLGHEKLVQARNMMLGLGMQDPRLVGLRPVSLEDAPQLDVNIDQDKAQALGLDLNDVNNTVAAAWGGNYINDFIDRGRVKKVYIQADERYRLQPDSLQDFFVRGSNGSSMAPFSAFSSLSWENGPTQLSRYNGLPSLQLQGGAAPGVASGTAMKVMEDIHSKLPPGTRLDWTGLSYDERSSSGQAGKLYGLSFTIVFLALAALYESWSVPIAVMLVVPLGVLGSLIAQKLTGGDNNIYLQVGLVTTMGLASKNAILIVEFAEQQLKAGKNLVESAVEAAHLRLRPILMTSLAFILGTLPLAIASGPGAGGQNAIGRAVVGGTLTATILAIFFVPLFFVVVMTLFRRHEAAAPQAGAPAVQGA
jgi:HAE1 family hydrophobic/amphiphilic exporter-1/multidrug efflux pump